ncbi:MAG TPA: glycoside hydrolase family 30 beta sandwich domain-containing protein [Prolixibacteraceae bacterium]|nr:glycoside hydrolase family 30 beta sandwich domain-containing protein [Prolixibacteraceae bacterium]
MKTNPLNIILLTVLIAFSGVAQAQKATLEIFPQVKRQIIKSVGGNYCQSTYTAHAADAIGNETLREFKPTHVRVALPMKLRNKSLQDYRGANYTKQPLVVEVLDELKMMKNQFGVKNFTLSVWDVPDDFIVDPARDAQRVIKPEAYDEVIQMVTDFFVKAKNDYGVEVDYFSFNESNGGYQIIFTPEETIAFIKKAGKKFAEAGLKTKFLLADTSQTKGTVEFATQIMADPSIYSYLGPLAFHCWWSEDMPDNEFERVAAFGKAYNKEVWCSELGFDAMSWKIKGMNESWDYALRFAKISHRMLKYAEVEVSLYWTWQNNYAIMSADTKQKYPSYYVTRHQVDFMNTGTQVVHSMISDPELLAVAGIRPDGKRVLQLINMKKEDATLEVAGFDAKTIDVFTTTEANNWETLKDVSHSHNGKAELKVKAQSVNTFVFN